MKRIIHHIAILLVCVLCTSVFASCSVLKTEAAKLFGVMSVLFSDETTDTVITDAESTDTAQPPQSDIESEAATEETSVDETTAAEPAETAPDMPLEGETNYTCPMKSYEYTEPWIKPVTVASGSYPVIIYDGSTENYDMSVILPGLSIKYDNGDFTERVTQDLYDNNYGGTIDALKDGTYSGDMLWRFNYYYASWDDVYAVVVCASGGPAYSEYNTKYFSYYFDKNGTPLTFDDCLERKGYTADDFFESFSPYFTAYSGTGRIAGNDEMLDCIDYFAFFNDGRIFVSFAQEFDNYGWWAYFNIRKTSDEPASPDNEMPFTDYTVEYDFLEPGLLATVEVSSEDGYRGTCTYVTPHIKTVGDAANIEATIRDRLEARELASLADTVTNGTCTAENMVNFYYFCAAWGNYATLVYNAEYGSPQAQAPECFTQVFYFNTKTGDIYDNFPELLAAMTVEEDSFLQAFAPYYNDYYDAENAPVGESMSDSIEYIAFTNDSRAYVRFNPSHSKFFYSEAVFGIVMG